jgi:hypothetical protein
MINDVVKPRTDSDYLKLLLYYVYGSFQWEQGNDHPAILEIKRVLDLDKDAPDFDIPYILFENGGNMPAELKRYSWHLFEEDDFTYHSIAKTEEQARDIVLQQTNMEERLNMLRTLNPSSVEVPRRGPWGSIIWENAEK